MKLPVIKLHRHTQNTTQTLGSCVIKIDSLLMFACVTLERGWLNNKRNVSCIPIGTYKIVLEYSNKFDMLLWEIKGVPNRSETKFHAANYFKQLQGCIAPGRRLKFINSDNYLDVTNSKSTLKDFHLALKGHTVAQLIVEGEKGIF